MWNLWLEALQKFCNLRALQANLADRRISINLVWYTSYGEKISIVSNRSFIITVTWGLCWCLFTFQDVKICDSTVWLRLSSRKMFVNRLQMDTAVIRCGAVILQSEDGEAFYWVLRSGMNTPFCFSRGSDQKTRNDKKCWAFVSEFVRRFHV